jgi:hypothetical protein
VQVRRDGGVAGQGSSPVRAARPTCGPSASPTATARLRRATPPRFLPEYDNLLLSRKDRTRVIPDNRPVPLPPGNGAISGTFLVDGIWQGTWQIQDQSLHIRPFTKLRPADRDALLTEAAQLRTSSLPVRSTT